MSVPSAGVGSGATAVLGARFVQGLAVTGVTVAKIVWLTLAGMAMLIAGAVTLGSGRRITAGQPLADAIPPDPRG